MSEDRISLDEIRYMSIFQNFTGVTVYRCIIDEDDNKLIFLVGKGEAGKAIGRGGRNVRILRESLGKDIDVVEYSDSLEEMVKNLFPGVRIKKITVRGRGDGKIVEVRVDEKDKGAAIGRGGRNVKRARLVLNKLFGVSRVVVR